MSLAHKSMVNDIALSVIYENSLGVNQDYFYNKNVFLEFLKSL